MSRAICKCPSCGNVHGAKQLPTPPSAIKNDNSCPGCGELVDVDEGFDGAPFRCDGCGKRSIWTAFDGGYFQLIESGEEDDN